MTRPVTVGIVPLVDAAPVLVAAAMGFDADEGLALSVHPQPSWAALRDLLVLGHLDAAHLLAPVAVALRLGLGGPVAPVDALSVLSLNGNTVGVSTRAAARMQAEGWSGFGTPPRETARAMALAAPRVGVPFAVSTHALLLRYLYERSDLTPPDLHAVPPSGIVRALSEGWIDAFCVGEPWGSAAIEAGAGEIVLTGRDVWAAAPEKVLARPEGADPGLSAALIRATVRAGRWLSDPSNATLAGEVLASGRSSLPAAVLDRALRDYLIPRRGAAPVAVEGLLRFGASAGHFPWRSQGAWIGDRLARAHDGDAAEWRAAGAAVFRSDLHRAALAGTGIDLPGASAKVEGALARPEPAASAGGRLFLGPDRFFDGAVFDKAGDEPPKP